MRRLISLVVLLALIAAPLRAATAQTPGPVITAIAPTFTVAGRPSQAITVYGSNFVNGAITPPGSVILWNGQPKATDSSKANDVPARLFGVLTDTDIACPGQGEVRVRNPNGDLSNPVMMEIRNNPPTANDDTANTGEDTAVSIDVLANDNTLPETAPCEVLSIAAFSDPANGSVAQSGGQLVYTPDLEFSGTDVFTYTVDDGHIGGFATATVTVTVSFFNDAPVAGDDPNYSTPEDTPLTISAPGVLGNDTDAENNALTAALDTTTANGTLTLNADGSFSYTPNANFNGVDTFTYTASDGTSSSVSATATITVTAVNDAPVAGDDSYNAVEDTALTVPAPGVLANDTDVDGDILTVTVQNNVVNGTLTLNPNGSFTYTPSANYSGPDGFTYIVSDGNGGTDQGAVSITVAPGNDAPVADDETYTVAEDGTLNVSAPGVLAGDTDADGDSLSATVDGGPSNGSLTLNPDGSFSYSPNTNFFGNDSFTYTVSDGKGGTDVGTVSITVTPVNDAPVANNDSYTTVEDTPLTIAAPGVLANDTDPDGDSLSVTLQNNVTNGTLTLNSNGSFTYTPGANFNGSDSFTYTVSDGNGGADVGTVTIDVTGASDLPVAGDDSYSTNEDAPLTRTAANGVLANDSDPDGAVTVVDNSPPSNGTLSINADGSFTYTPNADFFGADSFTYTIQDGDGNQATGTVSLTINAVNDQPTFTSGASSGTVLEDAPTQTVAGWASNPVVGPANESAQTYTYLVSSSNGAAFTSLDVDEGTGDLTYTLAPNANGDLTITVRLQDSGGTANGGENTSVDHTYQLTVTPVNDEPSFTPDGDVVVNEDAGARTVTNWATPISRGAANESGQLIVFNVGNDNNSLFSVQPSINTAGTLSFTPAANAFGVATVTVTLQDNGGTDNGGDDTSAQYTFTITVNAVNDAPTFTDAGNQTVAEDSGPQTVLNWATSMSTGPANEAGQTLLGFTTTNNNNALFTVQPSVSAAGTLTFTPAPNAFGVATVQVRLQDSGGTDNGGQDLSTIHSFTITITPVNDNPTANDDTYTMSENTAANEAPNPLDVRANDSILPDSGETLTVTLVTQPSNGTATVVNSGTRIAYVPNRSFVGVDSFTYRACDAGGLCDNAVVTITVTERFTPTYVPHVVYEKAPDLAVEIRLTPEKSTWTSSESVVVAVVLSNHGTLTATGTIWVDFYINPTPIPSRVGDTWDELGCSLSVCQGLAWKVTQPIGPGQRITLTSNKGSYDADSSRWFGHFVPGTTTLYAYADIWNPMNPAGAALEGNEDNNLVRRTGITVTGSTTAFTARPLEAIAPRSTR